MSQMSRMVALLVVFMGTPAVSWAADPVQNPAQDAASESTENEEKESGEEGAVDIPAVQVEGQKEQPKANDPVGTYKQPRWTVRRPFANNRVYVNPAGYAEFNIFFSPEFALEEPSEASLETQYEFEIGLGNRLQFDAYLVTTQQGWTGPFGVTEEKLEVRWAFADWGKIWGNPTLYLEWAHGHAPFGASGAEFKQSNGAIDFEPTESHTSIEPKLLLGGNVGERWFAATNLVFEQVLGEPENEYAITGGLSYLAHDPKLYLGVDVEAEAEAEEFKFKEYKFIGGPSLQWYPSEPVHIGLSAFVGPEFEKETEEGETEWESEMVFKGLLIAGYEF